MNKIKLPKTKIFFKYSPIYDAHWQEWAKLNYPERSYPTAKIIINYKAKAENEWAKEEERVLKELSLVAKLSWSARLIPCYIVGRCIPFSDPLTLHPYPKLDRFIDVLTHELIHQLFMQKGNPEKTRSAWSYFEKTYKNETRKTITHIVLFAIHQHIYLKFYNKVRLERDLMSSRKRVEYRRAWEIVNEVGHEKIIADFNLNILGKNL